MAKPIASIATAALGTAAGRSDSRVKKMTAVRAACRRLGLDEDDRRAIQIEATGKASMGDMDLAELGRLLDRLNRDWKGPMGHRAHVGKIRALWWTLYWLGAVDEPRDNAIDAFVFRQTGKARIQFLGHKEAFRVIEALKAMAARAGVAWPAGGAPDDDRRSVVRALWDALADRRLVRPGGCDAYLAAMLQTDAGLDALGRHQLDDAIRSLGKQLRRAMRKRGSAD